MGLHYSYVVDIFYDKYLFLAYLAPGVNGGGGGAALQGTVSMACIPSDLSTLLIAGSEGKVCTAILCAAYIRGLFSQSVTTSAVHFKAADLSTQLP